MTRLPFDGYLDHIRRESQRFRDVLASCEPAKRVPTCPDWDAGDLLWHLTEVQSFWAGIVRNRPADPAGGAGPTQPTTHVELVAGFDAANAALLAALEAADPAERAWTWSEEQTVGFIYRRQAHEALIHRLDAELTAGDVTPLDPRLAADGVDEALAVIFGGISSPVALEAQQIVRVDLSDTDAQVWLELGLPAESSEHRLRVVADPGEEPDLVVEGLAADVDAWLWNRRDDTGIQVAGDRALLDRFVACLRRPMG